MPRRKQTCPKRMKYDGKEPPEGAVLENGDAEAGDDSGQDDGSDGSDCGSDASDAEGSPSPPSLDPRPSPCSPQSAAEAADIPLTNHQSKELSAKGSYTESTTSSPAPALEDLYRTISPSHRDENGYGKVKSPSDSLDSNSKPLRNNNSSSPTHKPRTSDSSSILDKLASFTNGNASSGNHSSSSKSKYSPLSVEGEESAISKLSNFVKDPGKLLSKDPIRLKVPTPPMAPSSYQHFSAAMAASYLHPSVAAAAAAAAVVSSSSRSHAAATSPGAVLPKTPTSRGGGGSGAAAAASTDPDQPLDLSVKTKGLDLSTKSPKDKSSGSQKYVSASSSPLDPSSGKDMGLSSLRSLEQKFGSNAFVFDSRSSLKSHMYRHPHPMLPAFGGNLYTAALFNTQPLATTDQIYKLERAHLQQQQQQAAGSHSPRRSGHHTSSSSVSTAAHSSTSSAADAHKHHKPHYTSTPSKSSTATTSSVSESIPTTISSPGASAASAVSAVMGKDKKHTNLSCQCGKDFGTLYELTLHLRESGHIPNNKGGVQPEYPKLVRGQDMWLNQGSEQTRQILRCMQCGESFKSLPELTVHMIETKHYTNIVGTEASSLSRKQVMKLTSCDSGSDSDVFKCQVCDTTYDNMEGLTSHMMSSGHHKRPVIIQPEDPASPHTPPPPAAPSTERSTPKSPLQQESTTTAASPSSVKGSSSVRPHSPMSLSLLEYKYKLAKLAAEHHKAAMIAAGLDSADISRDSDSPGSDFLAEISKITCETCGDRIEMGVFVEHVRVCVGKLSSSSPQKKVNGVEEEGEEMEEGEIMSKDRRERDLKRRRESASLANHEPEIKRERTDSVTRIKEEHSDSKNSKMDSDPLSLLTPLPAANGPSSGGKSEGSALKAMESFIERSFTSANSHARNRYFPFKGPMRHSFFAPDSMLHQPMQRSDSRTPEPVNLAASRSTPEKDRANAAAGLFSNKYLPPLYVHPDHMENHNNNRPKSRDSAKDSKASSSSNGGSGSSKHRDSRSSTPELFKFKREKVEKEERAASETSSRKATPVPPQTPPKEKYIHEEAEENSNGENSKSSVSALESLQGLVYGKSFNNAEHPLDSLQKLIGNGNSGSNPHERQNGGTTPTMNNNRKETPPPSMFSRGSPLPPRGSNSSPAPATPMVLANVTLLTSASPPSRGRSPHRASVSPSALSPAQGSRGGHPQTPGASPRPPSRDQARGSSSSPCSQQEQDNESSNGGSGEYKCPGCKQVLPPSAYRYHVARCHALSSSKNSRNTPSPGVGDKKFPPYVYLPLDHSAKFNKYYEMANELANKTK